MAMTTTTRRMGAMRYAASGVVGVLLLLLALGLSGCGGSQDAAQHPGGVVAPSGRAVGEQAAEKAAVGETVVPGDWTTQQGFDRRIVKTAELGIRAKDVRESAARAQQVAAQFGGSVLSSQIDRGDGSTSAALVLSVPSPEFEKTLDELRGIGKEVTTDTVSGEDVTEEFVDLESRERNLLAAEQSLLKLYDRAQSVNDALTIERELTNIRGQIEQVQGRMQYLEERTAYSQISLTIQPVAHPTPPPAWNPAKVVSRAWDASLGVLQALATVVLSALVFGWWLAPALVAGFVWWRRRTRDSAPAATGPPQAP
jgi:hypothetical protein